MISSKEFKDKCDLVICPRYNPSIQIPSVTHRFFESVWLGCTPIVVSTGLDTLYRKYNALIVDSWEDVTEELLLNHEHKAIPEHLFDVNYFFNVDKI